jgi:Zn finger protein HypA/HybF involved in hydrogenase expression
MHEYTLMERVIASILETLRQEEPNAAVAEVILKVGGLEVHSEEAGRLAFMVLAQDTPLEKSRLSLVIFPASLECQGCGYLEPVKNDHHHGHEPLPGVACPRCGQPTAITGGRGVESIELVLS